MDILFGLGDNLILAIFAILGIDLDKKLGGKGVHGALYGALIGNTISDFLAGLIPYGLSKSSMIAIGCMIVIPFVKIYYHYSNKEV
tara:strand:+ start:2778 stop:3035 length:258 start_codon:yes stop_codon:yes gene_type:complete